MQFVDLHAQYLSIKDEVDCAIASVIEESSFVRGRHVEAFEDRFRELIGVKHCVSCGNGTDAIYIALKSLGLQPGDEVLVPAHTWIATSETVTQAGGKVVFCDSEPDYFTIDPRVVESKITPRTKGIIPVHLYGQPADMDPLLEIARRHNLWIIEDCAQAHLSRYKGRVVGTLGDIATFSFYPGKNLGAMGDAGAIVTNRDELAEFSALFARHGGKGNHAIEGINSRLDGLQAAILNAKLPHLGRWTELRQEVADRYDDWLSGMRLKRPARRDDCEHVYHLYAIRIDERDRIRGSLAEQGIPSTVNYSRALPFYDAYRHLGHGEEDFPIAFDDTAHVLSLPLYPELSAELQRRVVDALRQASESK